MQQQSKPLIFNLAISLRFIDIINKHGIYCRPLVETWNYNLRNTNSYKYH